MNMVGCATTYHWAEYHVNTLTGDIILQITKEIEHVLSGGGIRQTPKLHAVPLCASHRVHLRLGDIEVQEIGKMLLLF